MELELSIDEAKVIILSYVKTIVDSEQANKWNTVKFICNRYYPDKEPLACIISTQVEGDK